METDDRYSSDRVVTHDQTVLPFDTLLSKTQNLREMDFTQYSVVAIEEGQFFSDIEEVAATLREAGKTVIVSALHATFERKPFETTSRLLAVSDKIIHLTAVCTLCGADAAFTQLIGPRSNVANVQIQNQCLLGGAERYKAVCSKCYVTTL